MSSGLPRQNRNAGVMQKSKDIYKKAPKSDRSYFVILTLEKDVVEDIAQGEDALELEVLIHNHQTMNAGLADSVEDGVQPVI